MRSPWMSTTYLPLNESEYHVLKRHVNNKDYYVLLNAELGSWAVLTKDEYDKYLLSELDELKMENLYFRGLAKSDDGELVKIDFPEPAETPSVVVVNLTTACNLRCKYCFASCESEGDYMEPPLMKKIIEEMLKFPSQIITFELQGGEPLCHLTGMEQFIEISEEINKRYGKNIQYRTVTNATLVDQRFIDLVKKYNIQVCVSVDGPDELTDATRVDQSGSGAFKLIESGVQKLQKGGIEIDGAVCTLGQHNIHEPQRIMDYFSSHNISFKPRPANILGREIENETTTHNGEWAKCFKELYFLSKDASIENYSIHIYEENVYTPIRDYICLRYPCGAAREVISVNPDGTVYPCDGFKGVAEFAMGNLNHETLSEMLAKEQVQTLRHRTHSSIEKCSKCIFRAMCCSCCYSAYGKYGDVYREDPQCEDRRQIFLFLIDQWIDKNC